MDHRAPGEAESGRPDRVRPAVLAGSWYPAEPDTLRDMVGEALDAARRHPTVQAERAAAGRLRALLLPHAGLRWSGGVGACGAVLLDDERVRRVIVLGTAHYGRFSGISAHRVRAYETPLGLVPVDRDAVEALLAVHPFCDLPDVHAREHSIEIELPLLQGVMRGGFDLVPLLVSSVDESELPDVVAALNELMDDATVIVASSDLTHFGAQFDFQPFPVDEETGARLDALDRGALSPILDIDRRCFERYTRDTGITVCGRDPLRVLLATLESPAMTPATAKLLDYASSGGMTGDYSHSVSYAAVAFRSVARPAADPHRHPPAVVVAGESAPDHLDLDAKERAELLGVARLAIATGLAEPRFSGSPPVHRRLATTRPAFVTLKQDGELRGCIGSTIPARPLAEEVFHAARSAAFEDPRFSPVRQGELDRLTIEISVLTTPRVVGSPEEIRLGRDGVVLEEGARRSVFLPQVAPEQGWDRKTLLERLAVKAGLEPRAWIPSATYRTFEVERIEEPSPAGPPTRVLFLCTGNSCRSQMAEAWARVLHPRLVEAHSAGTHPKTLDPRAVRVMDEVGIDLTGQRPKRLEELGDRDFGVVVTVCADAHERCPVLPGATRVVHVGFDDPPRLARASDTEEQALDHYRRVRDEIRVWIETLPASLQLESSGPAC